MTSYGKDNTQKTHAWVQGQSGCWGSKGAVNLDRVGKKYEVSQVMISRWKGELLKNAGAAFGQQSKIEEGIENILYCSERVHASLNI